jgi:hypothetical protein
MILSGSVSGRRVAGFKKILRSSLNCRFSTSNGQFFAFGRGQAIFAAVFIVVGVSDPMQIECNDGLEVRDSSPGERQHRA